MGRTIIASKVAGIREARQVSPDALGPMLGEFVVDDHIPAEGIATLLGVAKPTVYRWIFGAADPRDKDKLTKAQKLLTILRKAKRAKELPLHGTTKVRLAALARLVETYKSPRPE